MRTTLTWARVGIATALVACTAATGYANKVERRGTPALEVSRDSGVAHSCERFVPTHQAIGAWSGKLARRSIPDAAQGCCGLRSPDHGRGRAVV